MHSAFQSKVGAVLASRVGPLLSTDGTTCSRMLLMQQVEETSTCLLPLWSREWRGKPSVTEIRVGWRHLDYWDARR